MAMHRTRDELEAGLATIRESPRDHGTLELIVCRPAPDERTVLETASLDLAVGLVGDTWNARPSSRMPDQSPHPDMQLTLMNARVIDLLTGERERWPLAGDQLYVDLDLSVDNLPPGSQLQIGEAVVEVTTQPHTGCAKFTARFGSEASRWVGIPAGRALNLRGINTRIIAPGQIRRGDRVRKRVG